MLSDIIHCSLSKDEIYQKIYHESHGGSYISYLRGNRCDTEEAFFNEISASFQFPWYFGENWAALDECLCDLEWLQFKRIFIVVDNFSIIFNRNNDLQELLVKYFSIMVEYWKNEDVTVTILLNN